jgi:hypothetical protein
VVFGEAGRVASWRWKERLIAWDRLVCEACAGVGGAGLDGGLREGFFEASFGVDVVVLGEGGA